MANLCTSPARLSQKPKRDNVTIELESLGVVWSMEWFHHFLYCTHFILEMDQKPLEAILSKSLNQATSYEHSHIVLPYFQDQ